jgi:hypothetical protein
VHKVAREMGGTRILVHEPTLPRQGSMSATMLCLLISPEFQLVAD